MIPSRITTLAYAQRHIQPYASNAEWGNVSAVAGADRGNRGRVKITNAEIAKARSAHRPHPLSERTVRAQTGAMVREGRFLRREGWTLIVVGAAEHTITGCPHELCQLDADAMGKIAAADELAARRRERARLKKARQRAARKAAEGS